MALSHRSISSKGAKMHREFFLCFQNKSARGFYYSPCGRKRARVYVGVLTDRKYRKSGDVGDRLYIGAATVIENLYCFGIVRRQMIEIAPLR